MNKIMILGGYGNFGKRIATALVNKGLPIILAGRDHEKASKLANELGPLAQPIAFDVHTELSHQLETLQPVVVVNTCGPFQTSDYSIAENCIAHSVHYVDLADGREFVTGINRLDEAARQAGICVISGASTVPGLSSAVLEHFKPEFSRMNDMTFGISPGQKAERGLATTEGIMTYVGKPLASFPATKNPAYGWQDIYRQPYPELGNRWMANCDIPDLDLLPEHYGLKTIRFSAGLELAPLHLGLWAISWLVRLGLPINLPSLSRPLLAISNFFNVFGTPDGGMHIVVSGYDLEGKPLTRSWFIIAKEGHGPHIPTIPAIILADRLAKAEKIEPGAFPCIGMIKLDDYLNELKEFSITTCEN